MRGRLFIAGVTGETPAASALDVLTVVVMDTPVKALGEWRRNLDRAALAARIASGAKPDRANWGLQPDQVESQRKFLSRMGGVSSPAT